MAKPENPVQLAVIGAPHGMSGAVRVKTFTGEPMALGDYGPLRTEEGRTLTVAELRPDKTVVVARFAEVMDRTAAEALNGTALFVDRSALPADLEEDEFYHADLIGLVVVDEAGSTVGTVLAVHDFGAGDVLEVRSGRGTVMIPFTRDAVPEIDTAAGRILVDSVAAGLVEREETDDEDEDGPQRGEMP